MYLHIEVVVVGAYCGASFRQKERSSSTITSSHHGTNMCFEVMYFDSLIASPARLSSPVNHYAEIISVYPVDARIANLKPIPRDKKMEQ